jgi:hypothetical protein
MIVIRSIIEEPEALHPFVAAGLFGISKNILPQRE